MGGFRSQAFIYHGKPQAVSKETITISCGKRDLLVEVLMCARCGTDRTIYHHGHPNVDRYAPVVLGHELVGRIVQVGDEVRMLKEGIGYRKGDILPDAYLDFHEGERVTFQSRIARYTSEGLMLIPDPIANLSFQINGGYARYMKVPESLIRSESVLRVPNSVTDEEACLVEPAACALESIFSTPHEAGVDENGRHIFASGIKKSGNVCIIGSGTVSMIYALLAKLEGANRVVMIVRSEKKAALVEKTLSGKAEVFISPVVYEEASSDALNAEEIVVKQLSELTDEHLFDDVIAACSSTQAQRLMLKLYSPEGYGVGACFGGTHRLVDQVNIDLHHYRAAKTFGTSGCSTACMKTILTLLAEDQLDLNYLISSQKYTLDDDPHEFFTTSADGLKPALFMRQS